MFSRTSQVVHAADLPLQPSPLDPEQSVAGSPHVSAAMLAETGDLSVGVWEHTAGVSTDVEADEVFVVLNGEATIEIEGGPTLDVRTGDVCILTAGSRTRWTVHEDLRKVYVTVS